MEKNNNTFPDIKYGKSRYAGNFFVYESRIINKKYSISDIGYQILNIGYRISNIKYLISNIEYLISNIKYRISYIKY